MTLQEFEIAGKEFVDLYASDYACNAIFLVVEDADCFAGKIEIIDLDGEKWVVPVTVHQDDLCIDIGNHPGTPLLCPHAFYGYLWVEACRRLAKEGSARES
jgi:hypothetical protein